MSPSQDSRDYVSHATSPPDTRARVAFIALSHTYYFTPSRLSPILTLTSELGPGITPGARLMCLSFLFTDTQETLIKDWDLAHSIRGIDIDSIMCAICDNRVETSRHLFFYCCMVRQIVRKITRWWDVPYVEVESYEDWYNWLVNLRISSMHKQMFEGIDVMRRLV
ncbi:hypothetical protein Tco_0756681, partial [Tanacetum coccineum]